MAGAPPTHAAILARIHAAEAGPVGRLLEEEGLAEAYPLVRARLVAENVAPMKAGLGRPGRAGQAAGLARILLNEAGRRRAPPRADVAVLSYSTSRMFRAGGGWPDAFAAPLSAALSRMGLTASVLEVPARGEYRLPRLDPATPVGMDELRARLAARRRPAPPAAPRAVAAARAAFEAEGLSAASLGEGAWARAWAFFAARREILARQIGAIGPRAGVAVTWYGTTAMAFVSAAQSAGVPVADYQHGAQGPEDCIYGAWPRAAMASTLMPRAFLVWTERDRENIEGWSRPDASAHAAGIPWHQMPPEVMASAPEVARLAEAAKGRRIVLVSLQPDGAAALDLVERMAEGAHARGLAFAVRLHPGEVDALGDVGARLAALPAVLPVAEATFAPLPALLAASAVHLTEFSSVALEAGAAGVPTVLTDAGHAGFFAHLGPRLVRVAHGADEALAAIGAFAEAGRQAPAGGAGRIGPAMEAFLSRAAMRAGTDISGESP